MKQWLKATFYPQRQTKPTDENIMRLLLPSILGIIICMACLIGMTWAWFTASIRTQPQTIEAASFDVLVSVKSTSGAVSDSDGTYRLVAGAEYEVTLTKVGTASSGYCLIKFAGQDLYVAYFDSNATDITFKWTPESSGDCTFTDAWGSYSGTAMPIANGNTIAGPDIA